MSNPDPSNRNERAVDVAGRGEDGRRCKGVHEWMST